MEIGLRPHFSSSPFFFHDSSGGGGYRGPETPLLLDVDQEAKSIYLITISGGHGCNEYFRYRYGNGAWRDDMLPENFELRPSNLLLGVDEVKIPAQITLDFKRKIETDYHRWSRYNIRFRQIGLDRCLCGHIGNPVKSGCRQEYVSTNIRSEHHG